VDIFWTKTEARNLWDGDQIKYAEIAHEYPCCSVPTIFMCLCCPRNQDECKNRHDVIASVKHLRSPE